MTPPPGSPRLLIEIAFGFVIWSVGFVVLYGMNAIGCAFLWPDALQRMVLAALTIVHLAALAALVLWLRKRMRDALDPGSLHIGLTALSAGTAAAAAGAAFLGFVPPLILTLCQ